MKEMTIYSKIKNLHEINFPHSVCGMLSFSLFVFALSLLLLCVGCASEVSYVPEVSEEQAAIRVGGVGSSGDMGWICGRPETRGRGITRAGDTKVDWPESIGVLAWTNTTSADGNTIYDGTKSDGISHRALFTNQRMNFNPASTAEGNYYYPYKTGDTSADIPADNSNTAKWTNGTYYKFFAYSPWDATVPFKFIMENDQLYLEMDDIDACADFEHAIPNTFVNREGTTDLSAVTFSAASHHTARFAIYYKLAQRFVDVKRTIVINELTVTPEGDDGKYYEKYKYRLEINGDKLENGTVTGQGATTNTPPSYTFQNIILRNTEYEDNPYNIAFVVNPSIIKRFQIEAKYSVYDEANADPDGDGVVTYADLGTPLRTNCTSSMTVEMSKFSLTTLTAGAYYDVFITIAPDFLYVLSDNDQNSDGYLVMDSDTPDYIDLGLPSGTLWATKNFGAESETDFGKYYKMGSLVEFDPDDLTKDADTEYKDYYNVVPKNPAYDVVNYTYGGNLMIPMKAQWQELLDNTIQTWTSDYNGTGVSGILFTATNGNSIFLPAASYYYDDGDFYRDILEIMTCEYWSSSMCYESGMNQQQAFEFTGYVEDSDIEECKLDKINRVFAMPIRPVLYTDAVTISRYNYVDLGIRGDGNGTHIEDVTVKENNLVKVLFATQNLGAESETDYGDRYVWGATEKYPDCTIPNSEKISSISQNLAYDAAGANWYEPWQLPTNEIWQFIVDNKDTKFTITEEKNYKGSGTNGVLIVSKIEGYEGNSIFLPYAGKNESESAGTIGCYWTGNPNTTTEAYSLDIGGTDIVTYSSSTLKTIGASIRPVILATNTDK